MPRSPYEEYAQKRRRESSKTTLVRGCMWVAVLLVFLALVILLIG